MAGVGPEAIHSVTCRRIVAGLLLISDPGYTKNINSVGIIHHSTVLPIPPICLPGFIRSFDFNSSDAVVMQSSAFYLWAETDRAVMQTSVETPLNFRKTVFNSG